MVARRLAKGRFGGQPFRGLLTVEIDVPLNIRLKLDSARVARRVGNQAAKLIRGRLRSGQDGDGSPLPQPEDGTPPAKITGRLLRNIRYDRKTGLVAPEFRRTRDDASKRARTSFGIMATHIAEGKWKDPMGSENDTQWAQIGKWTEDAIAKELDSGRGGLLMELRRIKRTVGR